MQTLRVAKEDASACDGISKLPVFVPIAKSRTYVPPRFISSPSVLG